ncbi:MAG: 4a-hydroxytetrahydrobiopterin dehydratase [Ignavibacteriales bacterium]|nr:4a-hydroxytetrahydrobiopterin dehydratase [Ignavibacteriales bacterium]
MKIFSIDDINNKLIELNSWQFINNTIEKEFVLNDFRDSLAFAVKIGIEAEKMDHHPDLLLHGWNKVKVTLTTHSAGGVTENDIKLAQTIDKITR